MPRPTPAIAAVAAAAALALAGCGSSSSGSTTRRTTSTSTSTSTQTTQSTPSSTTTPGPEGVPLEAGPTLAPAATTTPGSSVDGIQCQASEQVAYHIHAHLQVYANGQPRALPGAIGIIGAVPQPNSPVPFYGATVCYYWLHTHTSDGVIHVESPTQRIYTLGNFFDEWRQPLTADQVAGLRGRVSAIVDGKPWTKSPRAIPLTPHTEIQLAVGQPVPPYEPISWKGTGL